MNRRDALRESGSLAVLGAMLLLTACSGSAERYGAADMASTDPVPSPRATSKESITLRTIPSRILPPSSVEGAYCFVRSAPNDQGVPIEIRLPIAAVKKTEWSTLKDTPIPAYRPPTYCKPGDFKSDKYIARIADQRNGEFEFTVEDHAMSPPETVLSRTVTLSAARHYLWAEPDPCTPVGGTCAKFDGHEVFVYLANVRGSSDSLAKLVMLDLFAPNESADCLAERLTAPGTVVPHDATCPLPPWVLTTFGKPSHPEFANLSAEILVPAQTGSGGGYEPP
jgi:hypothetical protein